MPRKSNAARAIVFSIAMLLTVDGRQAVADNIQKLSGAQIRTKLSGKQFTDEVHWRDVYERDGTFRSYSMGRKRAGKWSIQGNELCLELSAPDDGCFEVTASGRRMVMTPKGNGLVIEGVIEPILDPK